MPRCNTEYHWLHQPIFKAINRGYNSIYNSIYSFQGGVYQHYDAPTSNKWSYNPAYNS